MLDRVSFSQPHSSQLTEEQKHGKKMKRLAELSAETARLLDLPEDSFILDGDTRPQDVDPAEEAAMASAMAAYTSALAGAGPASAAAATPLVHVPVLSGPADASAPVVVAAAMCADSA